MEHLPLKTSGLLPQYQAERPAILAMALKSVRMQTRLPDELVAVFDGPLPAELEDTFHRETADWAIPITIVRLSQNRGLGIALQKGIQACRGEYVVRFDSDDLNRPHRVAEQLSFASAHPQVDAFGCWIEEFQDQPGDLNRVRETPIENREIVNFMRRRNPMNHMTVMMKRSSVTAVGGYLDRPGLEDFYLWFRMACAGMVMANMPQVLVDARINEASIYRRRGTRYLARESDLFLEMLARGFITRREYFWNISQRAVLRLAPAGLLSRVYQRFLRRPGNRTKVLDPREFYSQ